jgi:hypothetical protein
MGIGNSVAGVVRPSRKDSSSSSLSTLSTSSMVNGIERGGSCSAVMWGTEEDSAHGPRPHCSLGAEEEAHGNDALFAIRGTGLRPPSLGTFASLLPVCNGGQREGVGGGN